jgi:DNA repair exonuclease SbcCD nuclease subunit
VAARRREQQQLVLRIGVVADPHLSVLRDEPAAWHNPYRLGDAHDRLDAALADPLLDDVDVFALLGDLAHFGDRASLQRCIEAVDKARARRPAILIGGNHDVLEPGVCLDDELEQYTERFDPEPLFAHAGIGLHVHDVAAVTDREASPFDVRSRTLVPGGPGGHLVLTHFPVLSLRRRAREAELLYSGHLSDLAPPVDPLPDDGPVVVLSGHLHLRGVTHEDNVLQLAFAALVEAPYEFARVEIEPNDAGLMVKYECASARVPDAEKLPILDPPSGAWRFAADSGWHQLSETRW